MEVESRILTSSSERERRSSWLGWRTRQRHQPERRPRRRPRRPGEWRPLAWPRRWPVSVVSGGKAGAWGAVSDGRHRLVDSPGGETGADAEERPGDSVSATATHFRAVVGPEDDAEEGTLEERERPRFRES